MHQLLESLSLASALHELGFTVFSAGVLVSASCAGLLSLAAAQGPGSALVWALSCLIAAVVLLLLQLSSQQVFLSLRFARVCSVLQRPKVPGLPLFGL